MVFLSIHLGTVRKIPGFFAFHPKCAHNEPMIKHILLSLVFMTSLTACSMGQSGVKGLQENTERFAQSIRWSSLNAAGAYMDPSSKEELMEFYGDWVKKNKTVEYSIVGTQMTEDKKKAQVMVEFSYYEIIHEQLLSGRQLQSWAYNKDTNKWMITDVKN